MANSFGSTKGWNFTYLEHRMCWILFWFSWILISDTKLYIKMFCHALYVDTDTSTIAVSRCWHCTKYEVFHEGFLQQMWPNTQETADLVTFSEEILHGKIHFLCSVNISKLYISRSYLICIHCCIIDFSSELTRGTFRARSKT